MCYLSFWNLLSHVSEYKAHTLLLVLSLEAQVLLCSSTSKQLLMYMSVGSRAARLNSIVNIPGMDLNMLGGIPIRMYVMMKTLVWRRKVQ